MVRPILVALTLVLASTQAPDTVAQNKPEAQPTVLHFAESEGPRTLDPHLAGDVISSRQCMHAYECLLEYDPFNPGKLQPCIAAAMPTYDAETLTYTFTIRDDVRFSDHSCFADGKGRAVTAQDVAWSLKRLAALPDSSGFWAFEGMIKGLDSFRESAVALALKGELTEWRKLLDSPVEGIRVPDSRTLQVRLNQPYPQLLYSLAFPYGAVVAHEACDKLNLTSLAVGTGPFKIKRFTESFIIWERNPGYRNVTLQGVPDDSPLKAFEGQRLPLCDEVRYLIQDDTAALRAFLTGDVLAARLTRDTFADFISADAIKAGKRGRDLLLPKWKEQGFEVIDYFEPTLHYLSFNMNDPVVGTPAGARGLAIRKAMALAYDRQKYVDERLKGRGLAADRLVPPGTPGHGDAGTLTNQRHDPAAARKVLKDAGFTLKQQGEGWLAIDPATGNQVTIQILFRSTSESMMEDGEAVEAMIANAGIKVVSEYVTFASFLARQDEGNGQVFDAGWVLDYPDAQNIMQLLYGPYKSPGINSACYNNATYNKLYENLAKLDDTVPEQAPRKKNLLAEMHRILDDETPWITVRFGRNIAIRKANLLEPPPDPYRYTAAKYSALAPD